MRVARSVLYGVVASLLLFSFSWAVQRGFFGEAPDVGEDRLRQTSRVGRPAARVVAAPSDENDVAAASDEDDVSIDPAVIESGERAAKRGPGTRQNGGSSPDPNEARGSPDSPRGPAGSAPPGPGPAQPPPALPGFVSPPARGGPPGPP